MVKICDKGRKMRDVMQVSVLFCGKCGWCCGRCGRAVGGCGDTGGNPQVSMTMIALVVVPDMKR